LRPRARRHDPAVAFVLGRDSRSTNGAGATVSPIATRARSSSRNSRSSGSTRSLAIATSTSPPRSASTRCGRRSSSSSRSRVAG
jgi:hypothetical protein